MALSILSRDKRADISLTLISLNFVRNDIDPERDRQDRHRTLMSIFVERPTARTYKEVKCLFEQKRRETYICAEADRKDMRRALLHF
jgi:hypothetical protein